MLSVFNATFANVGGCEGALIASSAATHLNSLTSNKPCPIFGDVERGGRREREEEEMGIDSSSAEKQQLAQGKRGKKEGESD